MLNKKICMLGACSVGKTALVEQFVHSIFSDRYLSTLGVKISKKILNVDAQDYMLMLWDLEGRSEHGDVNISYLRGAMGFFLVCDGTRPETLECALELRSQALKLAGGIPYMLLVNKADLADEQKISDDELQRLQANGLPVLKTSAKTGLNTLEAFTAITRAMAGAQ